MKELTVPAQLAQLDAVLDFIQQQLEAADCPPKAMVQIAIAAEEIFVNIAHYAYGEGSGQAQIAVSLLQQPPGAEISFADSGYPYDPLAADDPDITQSAQERKIGGLGVYMVKKSMDQVEYRYQDGKNIFTMRKNFS